MVVVGVVVVELWMVVVAILIVIALLFCTCCFCYCFPFFFLNSCVIFIYFFLQRLGHWPCIARLLQTIYVPMAALQPHHYQHHHHHCKNLHKNDKTQRQQYLLIATVWTCCNFLALPPSWHGCHPPSPHHEVLFYYRSHITHSLAVASHVVTR